MHSVHRAREAWQTSLGSPTSSGVDSGLLSNSASVQSPYVPLVSWVTLGKFLISSGLSFFICQMRILNVAISQGDSEEQTSESIHKSSWCLINAYYDDLGTWWMNKSSVGIQALGNNGKKFYSWRIFSILWFLILAVPLRRCVLEWNLKSRSLRFLVCKMKIIPPNVNRNNGAVQTLKSL